MTIFDGGGESDATTVVAVVPVCRILTSSFGRAVLATRPDSPDPDAGPAITVSRTDGSTCGVIVTAGPVAEPAGVAPTLDSPQPASRVAAAAAPPIRPTRWMAFLTLCSFECSRRPPPRDFCCSSEKSAARPHLTHTSVSAKDRCASSPVRTAREGTATVQPDHQPTAAKIIGELLASHSEAASLLAHASHCRALAVCSAITAKLRFSA